ncbi:MAG: helix-turn-helix transcriptional regulator [Candidatus Aenigmarchaeota archaeon]|nr:helix-turn-helix transcriptional regulator [Candidatus Aenigmarchaeota archaeon]
MDWNRIGRETEGLHTAESFAEELGISRQTAINYLHAMRREGMVSTERGARGRRLYSISPLRLREFGFPGLAETISANSPLKLSSPVRERSDHEITIEEAIASAAASGDFRMVMASLPLFRKVSDWWELYRFSRRLGVAKQVGALYSLSRLLFRVRSADRRVLTLMKKARVKDAFIIKGMRSSDFAELEKEWGVLLPFNRSDLDRLKETGHR